MDDEKYKYKSLEVLDDLFKDTIIKLQENFVLFHLRHSPN